MTRRRWIAALAGLGLAPPWLLAQVTQSSSRRARTVPRDSVATSLQWPDLEGRMHRLVDGTPRLRIVNLWAQRLAARLDPPRYQLLTLALDDDAFALREFARGLGFTLPVLQARQSELPAVLRVQSLPQTVLLGADGQLLGRVVGARDWDQPAVLATLLEPVRGAP
jgi:hypothetical protein